MWLTRSINGMINTKCKKQQKKIIEGTKNNRIQFVHNRHILLIIFCLNSNRKRFILTVDYFNFLFSFKIVFSDCK